MTVAVQSAVKVKVQDLTNPTGQPLDYAMDALTPSDAALYRALFAAHKKQDWAKAETIQAKIADKRLMGHVLADRYARRGASAEELKAWLTAYSDLPEAEDLYDLAVEKAKKERKTAPARLPEPATPAVWTGTGTDTAVDFPTDLKANIAAGDTKLEKLAQKLSLALRRHDPAKARDLLIAAQANEPLAGTFVADAEAAIAARFFYAGERAQAQALAMAAAGANQPLGLWIKGLIAWEQDDLPTATASFARLAEHPSLEPATRAAAQFWAARAESRGGNVHGSRAFLEEAARQPRSFYGLLAAQLLGRKPGSGVTKDSLPKWDREQRAVLVAQPAGWRALALIQVGENDLAQDELRRLNPQGQGELQQAMLALGGFVPMPGLVVQLASLTAQAENSMFDSASYPVPPWQPQQGFEVDRALLYALMRHESHFDPAAISAQGALGLMQIMPKTATIMHASLKNDEGLSDTGFSNDKLFDPAFNMAMGQRYLAYLASQPRIGDNLILLLASYNGGPTKLTDWAEGQKTRLTGAASRDPLLFLESIPARETRSYVMRVLPHYWAYRAKLGESLTSLRQLAEGQWPRFTLADSQSQTAATGILVPARKPLRVAEGPAL